MKSGLNQSPCNNNNNKSFAKVADDVAVGQEDACADVTAPGRWTATTTDEEEEALCASYDGSTCDR